MNQASKILHSKGEIRLLKQQDFFFSKKSITEKIFHQLSALAEQIRREESFSKIGFPKHADISRGKISKGENYLSLPYIILDFPRLFYDKEIFAFRTMVWWGNFLSNTLIISGEQLDRARKNFLSNYNYLSKKDVWLCINESPWHHHFKNDNFIQLKKLLKKNAEEIFSHQNFLKLSRKLPVEKINLLQSFSLESFEIFSSIMKTED